MNFGNGSSLTTTTDPCVIDGVEPLLTELPHPVGMDVITDGHAQRARAEAFVRQVFAACYGADIRSFYPTLLTFTQHAELMGVVGVRNDAERPFFAEQYLDAPLDELIGAQWDEPVEHTRIVEVGNLALLSPGQARWVIAAVTLFLHTAGFRWVLFTAVKPLINAFRRLGLNPIELAPADPARLSDNDSDWGSYYAGHPLVCVGDIAAGYRKLLASNGAREPLLRSLLEQVREQARTAAPAPLPSFSLREAAL